MTEKDLEDVRLGIKETVSMFRILWEEVDAQFPQLSKGEKVQIFGVIAPILSDIILTLPDFEDEED